MRIAFAGLALMASLVLMACSDDDYGQDLGQVHADYAVMVDLAGADLSVPGTIDMAGADLTVVDAN